jgi:YjbE family integral membrane protein
VYHLGVNVILDELLLLVQLVLINLVLSGDNAVVIALASKNLPEHERKRAVWWGTLGAITLRLILTFVAVQLLTVPYIHLIGSILLLWLATKLLVDDHRQTSIQQAVTLRSAIWTIIGADFIMSLDNVLAIAAKANGNELIIILGIGLSIPMIIWGSQLILKLLNEYPILVYLGAAILGYTAGEMFVQDQIVVEKLVIAHTYILWAIPIGATLFVVTVGIVSTHIRSKT